MKTVLDVLDARLMERVGTITSELQRGGAKDFAEYKELCGVIRGLNAARIELQDLAKNLREHDD